MSNMGSIKYLPFLDLIPALDEVLCNVQHHWTVDSHVNLRWSSQMFEDSKEDELTSCQGIRAVSKIERVLLA